MKRGILFSLTVWFCLCIVGFTTSSDINSYSLQEVLIALGDSIPDHFIDNRSLASIGEQLVLTGTAKWPDGHKSKVVSKYYNCTSCHNLINEDPDLKNPNPDDRLPYLKTLGKPFLQGSTFWGIVNRESWYNGDYYLKYGERVRQANKSIRSAIQLCAVECSQGRSLKQEEEDAILAYFWTLQIQYQELDLPQELEQQIQNALVDKKQNMELVSKIKTYYPLASDATFSDPPKDKKKGYAGGFDLKVGQNVYKQSCQFCHAQNGVSRIILDDSPLTFKYLKKNLFKDSNKSIYQIVRKGTYASPGARPYMPHYPLEKMSDFQLESLRAYVTDKAIGN